MPVKETRITRAYVKVSTQRDVSMLVPELIAKTLDDYDERHLVVDPCQYEELDLTCIHSNKLLDSIGIPSFFAGCFNPLVGSWWPAVGDPVEEAREALFDFPKIDKVWVLQTHRSSEYGLIYDKIHSQCYDVDCPVEFIHNQDHPFQ